jgi:hypothetical protein
MVNSTTWQSLPLVESSIGRLLHYTAIHVSKRWPRKLFRRGNLEKLELQNENRQLCSRMSGERTRLACWRWRPRHR